MNTVVSDHFASRRDDNARQAANQGQGGLREGWWARLAVPIYPERTAALSDLESRILRLGVQIAALSSEIRAAQSR